MHDIINPRPKQGSDVIGNEGVAEGKRIDFMEILRNIPQTKRREMQLHIERLGWSLQYSIPPENASFANRWQPPSIDSVDVIIKNMFLHVQSLSA